MGDGEKENRKRALALIESTPSFNGLPVRVYRVRVNRYVIVFMNMLTNIFGYGTTDYKIKVAKKFIIYMVGKFASLPILYRRKINFCAKY